jgi:hypothetical protein
MRILLEYFDFILNKNKTNKKVLEIVGSNSQTYWLSCDLPPSLNDITRHKGSRKLGSTNPFDIVPSTVS